MKNTFFLILASTTLFFCGCSNPDIQNSTSSFTTISGTIEGGAGQKLFLNKISNKQKGVVFDTIVIADDNTFDHQINTPLKLDYYVLTNNRRKQVYLITDSTENVIFNANFNSINSPTEIKGSKHTEVYFEMFDMAKEHNRSLEELDDKIIAAKTIDEKKLIGKEKKEKRETFRATLKEYIDKNADSPGIAGLFEAIDYTKELELASQTINHLAKTIPYSNYYKIRETHVKAYTNPNQKKAVRSDTGKLAPNIELEDPDGVEKTLYELRGKVVLIDFWASWCGPCRRENPNVVKAYNKYNDLGFEVFSVSLDSSRDKWVKAIEDDGLIWDYHVSDLKKWNTPYKEPDSYNFNGIPHTVLVGRDGNIIQSKIRGSQLEEKLESIFGF